MWLSDRRKFLLGALALGAAGCGFRPAFGPGGRARLVNRIRLQVPQTPEAFAFNRRFEERLGRAGPSAPFTMDIRLDLKEQGVGSTSAGSTTRFRIIGTASYVLKDAASGLQLQSGTTNAFTGYSTTGSTVATLAAERDAKERLMVILADQVIDLLLISAVDLPE